eukprot:6184610-Pleurochrysis_carterae.AAC.2
MPRNPMIHIKQKRTKRTTHSTPNVVRKVTEHHHTPILSQSGQIWIMHSASEPASIEPHSRGPPPRRDQSRTRAPSGACGSPRAEIDGCIPDEAAPARAWQPAHCTTTRAAGGGRYTRRNERVQTRLRARVRACARWFEAVTVVVMVLLLLLRLVVVAMAVAIAVLMLVLL